MLTKAEARNLTAEWLDDTQHKRWSQTRIDLAIQLAIDDLYTDCLDINSNLTSQLHTITDLVSPGYIDLRLASQGGQLTQRFYRVQKVTRANQEYNVIDARNVVIGSSAIVTGQDFGYFVQGDFLWLLPFDLTTDVELRYSFKPTPFTALTDGMYVPFPEGSESAYVLMASATTMAKGNAEDAGQLWNMAETARKRCLDAIRRQSTGMMVPFATDTPSSWGG